MAFRGMSVPRVGPETTTWKYWNISNTLLGKKKKKKENENYLQTPFVEVESSRTKWKTRILVFLEYMVLEKGKYWRKHEGCDKFTFLKHCMISCKKQRVFVYFHDGCYLLLGFQFDWIHLLQRILFCVYWRKPIWIVF